jgi:tetratricopeptide (TPR) repeat protein
MNRPREALEFLLRVETDQPGVGGFPYYWTFTARSYHHLGEYQAAIDVLSEGMSRTGRPRVLLPHRLRGLAALGEVDQVLAELGDLLSGEGGRPVGHVPNIVGELRAHGYDDSVPQVLEQSFARLGIRSEAQKRTVRYQALLAGALFAADRLEEADSLLRVLASEDPHWLWAGYLGVIAAKRGDRDGAEAFADLRDSLHPGASAGQSGYWRAAIAANLGELDRAIGYLNQSATEGFDRWDQLRCAIELEALWDHPAFQEFLRPKG